MKISFLLPVNIPRIVSVAKGFKEALDGSKSTPRTLQDTQEARKRSIINYCLKHPHNRRLTDRELTFVIVDDVHKIIFCSVPKVASSTWKRVLADLQELRQGIYVHRPSLWRRLGEYSEEGQSHRLKNYFKFIFVREPLYRILSAYKDKFIGKNRVFSKNIRKMIINSLRSGDSGKYGQVMEGFSRNTAFDKDANVSFPEFVRYYSEDIPRNPHWRQFKDLCHPCFINYDVIGNFETLAEDAALVLKMAGIDDRVNFPPIHNATGSHDMEHYYSQVPPEDVVRLAELYRNDYELFGYEFLGPVKHLLNRSSNIGV
ncbi:carbohydrate sulfotransferase 12-like [Stylophora pistillata]|uniref:carbohydrate sulfotransferase 12-like n=1 Tax=Stylophora pistillata TaxID=50429 RepID=UPI000C04555E|nr:carbohydrate sulfotransferase 12-like [Stylophora pistillata]